VHSRAPTSRSHQPAQEGGTIFCIRTIAVPVLQSLDVPFHHSPHNLFYGRDILFLHAGRTNQIFVH